MVNTQLRLFAFLTLASAGWTADVSRRDQTSGPSAPISANKSSCTAACEHLSALRPGQLQYPGTSAYEDIRKNYWDKAQSTTNHTCFFQPANASDVSLVLSAVKDAGCPFAIKSGGHGRFSGESSIEGGLGIDLAKLNAIKVSDDRKTVTVGPGLRYREVYTTLEPLGITVVGGRNSDVGVGGFLLAGGISFLSNEYGWATDNIQSIEVVLANGTVAVASASQNADLFKVLRGGGANFGVATSFTLNAFPYTEMWGGLRASTVAELDGLLDAFDQYATVTTTSDPRVSFCLNIAKVNGSWIFPNDLEYSGPVQGGGPPAALKPFTDLPAVIDETGVRNTSSITISDSGRSPRGQYNSYWVLVAKHDPALLRFYVDTFIAEADQLAARGTVAGFEPASSVQNISPAVRRAARRGGSILGDGPLGAAGDEPLLLFNPATRFADAQGAAPVYALTHRVLAATQAKARALGKEVDFLYMNYASQFQDPLGSYGDRARRLLRAAAAKYDPDGVFQSLRAAGFKLDGAYDQTPL